MTDRIKLVSPAPEHEADAASYVADFAALNEEIHGGGSIKEFETYAQWLDFNEKNRSWETVRPGWVPGETFFGVQESDGRIIGMVNLRYHLSDFLLRIGGHIGYSVRPGERRKGYATQMLALACEILRDKGIERVLVTCNEDNLASAGVIKKNGGVLENCEWDEADQRMTQRYWIDS